MDDQSDIEPEKALFITRFGDREFDVPFAHPRVTC
jgi:hypothetical protein